MESLREWAETAIGSAVHGLALHRALAYVLKYWSYVMNVLDLTYAYIARARRRGEAAGPELGNPEGERPHARDQPPLAVAVPAVAGRCAELVGLRAHDLVHDALGELPEHLLVTYSFFRKC